MFPFCGSAPEGVLGCHLHDLEEHFERILGDILVPLGSISTHVDDMLDR